MSYSPRTASPGRLRSLLAEHRSPVLLLGAGASITSGVPAAGDTVERAAKWAWCKENGRSFDDPTVRPSDYKPWLAAKEWFNVKVNLPDLYPQAVDQLLGVKRDRRDFFERLISPPVPPSRGYRSLARILHQGWIHTVLTTNFDDCLQKAVTLENQPHYIAKIKTIADLVMFSVSPPEPQLLYIHGSVEHYTDKNLVEEVQSLNPELVDRLRPLLRDHPVIVVGYRGTERSVMEGLFLNQLDFTNSFAQGVYWCTLQPASASHLSPFVEQLAERIGSNFNSVTIPGFDELFEIELWKLLEAKKTPPARRNAFAVLPAISFDMQPLRDSSLDLLDTILMQARLKQYAEKLRFWISEEGDWVIDAGKRLHLVSEHNDLPVPTNGGILLFGNDPSKLIINSRIHVRIRGPAHWLRSCFGSDIELNEQTSTGDFEVDREITGNLWYQLDQITEILSLINITFRLKAELSKQVQAYNSIALKEAIVNALVHRDYERSEPVTVSITPRTITVLSPGGLIDEVRAATANSTLEQLVKSDKRGIKGYRNPVISDLFYGGGQMDRAGSGLSDLWQATVNNNGSATFGPDAPNEFFVVELQARPEVVDEVTKTALPKTQHTHRFSVNALPFHQLPRTIWCASTNVATMRGLSGKKFFENLPSGYLHDQTFYTVFDLDRLRNERPLPFQKRQIFTLSTRELLELPNGRNMFVKLLNEALFEHFRTMGLQIDYRRKRVHYPKPEDADERKVSYQARVRRATRTVVKARRKQNGQEIVYFEHKALGFQPLDFGDDWALILSPGYTFTRDGIGAPIGRERINILSTRRAAKDFNQAVQQDVAFWTAMLSDEVNGVFALRCRAEFEPGAPTILLSSIPPTVSYGAESFMESEDDWETTSEFDDLENEIIELAEQEARSDGDSDKEEQDD